MNGDEKEVKVNGLMDDNQDAEMTKEKEEEMRRGPKIGNDVQVILNNIKFQESYKVSMEKLQKN